MNEENLGALFAELPKKCLVLLEDIDTAGLTHTRDEKQIVEDVKPVEVTPGSGTTVVSTNSTNGRISLSALLNILDGVASHEGRVLVMTTNHIEKLDEALIRPGRVDMTVKFDLATTEMIKTIFRAIFATLEGDIPKSAKQTEIVIRSPMKSADLSKDQLSQIEDDKREAEALEAKRILEEKRISELATDIANIIPSMTFSPAEIQGYLLKNKREPQTAIRDAEEWVRTTLTEKKKKEKEQREKEEKEKLEMEEAEKEKAEKDKKELETTEKSTAEKEVKT
jgi:chaperone BCS1